MSEGSGRHIAIIGGGISGLAAAYRLQQRDPSLRISVFEASDRLGGNIRTERVDGFIVEGGPDAFLANKPRGTGLAEELGLADDFVAPDPAKRGSFILRNGRLHRMPEGLTGLIPTKLRPILETPLISPKGKLRMALDFVRTAKKSDADESVSAFLHRRLGTEATDNLIEPLMAGIYAGDASQLSLAATFPQLRDAEQTHGGLIKGMLATKRAAEKAPANAAKRTGFLSFRGGMGQLIDTLADRIRAQGGEIVTSAPVRALAARAGGGYDLTVERDGRRTIVPADGVLIATPAWAAAPLVTPLATDVGMALAAIPYVSTALIALAFDARDMLIPNALQGYGYVVPRREGRAVMAMTWLSSKWQGRAPEGQVLVRGFVGRSGQDALFAKSDDELITLVHREVEEMSGIHGEPTLRRVFRAAQAMPQYNLGHLERVGRIERGMVKLAGIELAGNYFRGVGIPDAIASGEAAAERLLSALAVAPAPARGDIVAAG